MVLPDDQQFLTRRSIVAAGHIAKSAIADIKAIDNGEAKRAGTLDNSSTHGELHVLAPKPDCQPSSYHQSDYAHPHWDFSASNGGVPSKHQAQQMHNGYNCKDNNCRDREWLVHSVIDHLEREKRGWAGIKPRRSHFAFSAG